MKKLTVQGCFSGSMAWAILFLMIACMSCSKTNPEPTPVVQPPPVVSAPSGVIQSFVITDSLIPFDGGSTLKWLVNGTNNQTVVTFNGVIVGVYGVLDTGPLKKNTVYTLALNNGKQASLTAKVADSVTTFLWGGGKRWRQTRLQIAFVPKDSVKSITVDTPMKEQIADQRIYFNLDGTSKILQSTSSRYPPPPDGGKFIIGTVLTNNNSLVLYTYTWQGIVYTITYGSLDGTEFTVSYVGSITTGGQKYSLANTYKLE